MSLPGRAASANDRPLANDPESILGVYPTETAIAKKLGEIAGLGFANSKKRITSICLFP